MIDVDLMEKCCDGKLLQGCEASSKFICDCSLEHEHSKYQEIEISDLSPYSLIGTFLQSCDKKKLSSLRVQKMGT